MKNNYLILAVIILLGFHSIFAQKSDKNLSLDKGSIQEQFEFIHKKSSNYQNYKVVKRIWLQQLEKHILDSLQKSKQSLVTANNQILLHQKTIDDLKANVAQLKNDLATVNETKDHINLLGMPVSKSTFKTSLWSLVGALLIALALFIYRFKNSNDITKKTLEKFTDLEQEYNTYRTRALEREQVLNRKLQDEINKQKKG